MLLTGKTRGRPITKVQFEQIIKKFVVFLKIELSLRQDIPIIYEDDPSFSKKNLAFGMIKDCNIIHLSIINRHPMDIMRSLAHEYVHYKQHIQNSLSKSSAHAGSIAENQANAKAGELMRKYGERHPELFDFMAFR